MVDFLGQERFSKRVLGFLMSTVPLFDYSYTQLKSKTESPSSTLLVFYQEYSS
jgi:hypothetical protein